MADSRALKVRLVPLREMGAAECAAWARLQESYPELNNPFFRPEFGQVVGRVSKAAEVAFVERADEIIAVFPFERSSGGIARPIGDYLPDVQGIIADPTADIDVEWLLRECGLVAWTFDHLIASQKCFEPYHGCLDISPYIDVSGGYEAYADERRKAGSDVLRTAERRKRRLAREVGPVRFEWHVADDALFSRACDWKRAQLQRLYFSDMFNSPYIRQVIADVRKMDSEPFQFVLSALFAGDHPIAAHFGVRSYRVMSSWIPMYDEQYARHSPGLILMMELARHTPAVGIDRIDLGRGENQTKMSLMSGSIRLALGAVDLRRFSRLYRKTWFRLRDLVYATPLKNRPLRWYRHMRNRVRASAEARIGQQS